MKKTVFLLATGCLGLLACSARAEKTDGTYWNAESSVSRKTGELAYWLNRTIACDGGTATFADTPASQTLTNNITGWTLGGLALNGFSAKVAAEPIFLTGDAEVSGTGSPVFLCTVQAAEATATLTKRGFGTMTLAAPLAGFAGVSLWGGTLATTNAQGVAVADGPITISNGTISWAPNSAAGENVSATVGGDSLAVRGNAEVRVTRGKAASATLTLPTLDLSERSPLLRIIASGGSEALGGTEKVLVSGTVPETVNGCVDPRLVTRATDTGKTISFLAYDAAKGFVPAEATGSVTDEDAATKIVKISSDTTLPANAKVGALVVEGKPAITGTGLTVGDGVHPAGVIINESTKGKTDLSKMGTLAFGEAPGILWQGNQNSGDDNIWSSAGGDVVLPTITGTKGVTFASAKEKGFCNFYAGSDWNTAAGWSGPTRLAGPVRFIHGSAACFPQNGDVFVEGGELYTTAHLVYPNQHFHFAGKNRSGGTAYKTGGSPDIYFDGPVTLTDTITLAHDNDGCLWFRHSVDGKGGINNVNKGRVAFTVPCTFEGGVRSGESSRCIYASGKGTFGTGSVVAQGNNSAYTDTALQLQNNFGDKRAVITHPNDFTVTGHGATLNNSCVAFPNRFSANQTLFDDRVRVGVGPKVDLGELSGAGGLDFYGVAVESALTLSVTNSRVLAFDTADGANGERLSLTKKGAGTLTWSGRHTHTGTTTIGDGTLKIEADPLKIPSLRSWLDASDESTVTEDANGRIVSWRSKTGDLAFTPPKWSVDGSGYQFYGPTYAETLNGKKVASFRTDKDNNVYTRLVGDRAVPNRHLFFVIRIKGNQTGNDGLAGNCGLFGAFERDYGLRISWNGGIECNPEGGQFATRYMRANGVENTGSCLYTPDKYFLFEAFHDEYDNDKASAANRLTVFRPILGGYFQWTPWRNAEFDLAEMLTFDTVLTDAERVTVENYLAEKWAIPGYKQQTVPEKLGGLSAESDLVLCAPSATLDLNGFDATVKGLSGCGKIVNSGDKPVTLKVTGDCSFRGSIASNVTLDLSAGGSAKIEVQNALPVRDGLAFWVDASYKPEDYVVTNAEGRVTDWLCRAGTIEKFTDTKNATRTLPHGWSATGLAGVKPALYFDGSKADAYGDSLDATGKCSIRTLFLVCEYKNATGNNGFFGLSGADNGLRCSYKPTFRTADGFTGFGDEIFVNETDYTGNPNAALVSSGVSVVSVRCACDRPKMIDQKFAIGQYVPWNVGLQIYISEVIAYDRILTDGEFLTVKNYLSEKWSVSTALPADEEGQPFELANLAVGPGSASLTGDYVATGDWLFDFGGLDALGAPLLAVDGSLALNGANARFANVTGLALNSENEYLTATELKGDFAATDLSARRFDRKVSATSQTILRFRPGTLLMVK